MKSNGGDLTRATRWRLAKQAFALTAAYDTAIANTLDQIAEAPAVNLPASPDKTHLPATLRINLPLALGIALRPRIRINALRSTPMALAGALPVLHSCRARN
ncbi:MAG: hypothetical protein WDM87_00635 [Terracidiphilus sp.]